MTENWYIKVAHGRNCLKKHLYKKNALKLIMVIISVVGQYDLLIAKQKNKTLTIMTQECKPDLKRVYFDNLERTSANKPVSRIFVSLHTRHEVKPPWPQNSTAWLPRGTKRVM